MILRLCGGAVAILSIVLLADTAPVIRFVDITESAGLTLPITYGDKVADKVLLETTGTGAAIFDFNDDGFNDIFIANGTTMDSNAPPTRSPLYRNDGTGHFTEVGLEAGLTRSGWAQGACAGDFDNDGHTDLLVTYYGHNSLYRNLGTGKFADVTKKAGLPVEGTRWGSGCAFLDYDRDGYLDFVVANYVDLNLKDVPKPGSSATCKWKGMVVVCGPRGLPMAHNVLYHNNRDGTFTDVSEKAGILAPGGRYGLGVVTADFDGDGWSDIYIACDQTPSLLYRNQHDGTFEERGDAAGVAYNMDGRLQAGMGIAVADYDGNGFLDIAKTNFSGDRPSLYRNEDGKFFEDVAERAGLGRNQLLGWGAAFLDVDEDGWPDLVMANGHVYPAIDRSSVGETYRQKTLLYRNLGDGHFADVTASAGPAFQEVRPGRGLATGDLDGDGRPEILIVNVNDRPSLLRNESPRQNAIAVTLTGTKSNRSAIGARCAIEAGGRKQIAEVMGGGSYYSQNSFTLYFGVAKAPKVDRIEIRWPNGETQSWRDVAVNRTVGITEGRETLAQTPFRTLPHR
jgi:hypothetical protein